MFPLRLSLLIVAILSVASAPVGYMPMRTADGRIVLQICNGIAPAADMAGMPAMNNSAHDGHGDHGGHKKTGETHHEKPCDYSAAGQAALPTLDLYIAPLQIFEMSWGKTAKPLTGIYPEGLPPATGPPAY